MKNSRMKDMSVGGKLFLSYGFIIGLYILTIGAAMLGISKVSRTLDDFYDIPFKNASAAMEIRAGIQGVGRNSLYMIVNNKAGDPAYMEMVRDFRRMVDEAFAELERSHPDDGKVQELRSYLNIMEPEWDKLEQYLMEGDSQKVVEIYQTDYEQAVQNARRCLIEMVGQSDENARLYLDNGHRIRYMVIAAILVLGAFVLFISSVMWFAITKSIREPVEELNRAAKRMAQGDLGTEIHYQSADELGSLAESMRETIRSLKLYISEVERGMQAIGSGKLNYKTQLEYKGDFIALGNAMDQITKLLGQAISQIGNSAEQVAGGAEQMAGGAQMLSQGAVQQASSMEELAANIDEISDGVKNNAEDSVNVSRKVDEVGLLVDEGSIQMQNMKQAIMEIRENSSEITGIVKEIEDIAFQTNILALNASVEAARAGEAGRGFSVVADEVRRLSSKTSEASRMMARLAIQTTEKVDGGTRAVNRAAVSLEKIQEGTQEVTKMVDRISDASVSQADSIIQIRQAIEMVSDIVQGNSATSQESAAASEELAAQALLLKKLVEEFEV